MTSSAVLYNTALRQSKSLRNDLSALSTNPSPDIALQGQVASSLTAFSRTLDEYQKSIDIELVPSKVEKSRSRIAQFKEDLASFRTQFAAAKAEREQQQLENNRSALFAESSRRRVGEHATDGGASLAENPYSDAAVRERVYGAAGRSAMITQQELASREQSFFSNTNRALDEYLERGRAVLGDLSDQKGVLKGTQRKLYSVGTTLGISGDTIRMVERRARSDKWIFWGCVVIFVVFVYLVLRYLK
ncbi:hypothetical protein K470DRAFT_214542 [Piedraia hortae CBS 480.64]|uniref:Protein transport protein BOS1 n=1 Tax=Piedraia hortae CBS 480.64 TaxID=1314780 RepID=A0A6A7C2T6_9PEZI|nr:hypothetical protein K470DRAFT_214542 [Piedraia hortae CBS 480.64]